MMGSSEPHPRGSNLVFHSRSSTHAQPEWSGRAAHTDRDRDLEEMLDGSISLAVLGSALVALRPRTFVKLSVS